MNTKILETLEFNKIKALFEPHLLTEQGLEELKGLAPTTKTDKIKQAFTEMEEMQALLRLKVSGTGISGIWNPNAFRLNHSYIFLSPPFTIPLFYVIIIIIVTNQD